mgnify:FL=1
MIIQHHSKIDKSRWDKLVDSDQKALVFNKSYYLDAVCDNWYLYHDDLYSCGIVVCSTTKLGIPSVFPPFFHRSCDLVGDSSVFKVEDFESILLTNFKYGIFQTSQLFSFKNIIQRKDLFFQELSEDIVLSNQAKRKMKNVGKLYKVELKYNINPEDLIALIFEVLPSKVGFFKTKASQNIKKLIQQAGLIGDLYSIGGFIDGNLVGGLFVLKYNGRMIYLKGACKDEFLNEGMMYYLMNALIVKAKQENLVFDFGGSNIEGVKYFNTKFGSKDISYNMYQWNNSPFWFKALMGLKNIIK